MLKVTLNYQFRTSGTGAYFNYLIDYLSSVNSIERYEICVFNGSV